LPIDRLPRVHRFQEHQGPELRRRQRAYGAAKAIDTACLRGRRDKEWLSNKHPHLLAQVFESIEPSFEDRYQWCVLGGWRLYTAIYELLEKGSVN